MSETPLWVKIFVAAALAVGILIAIVIAAGGHSPQRHGGGEGAALALAADPRLR